MKVGGCCYYHAKLVAHLLRSSDGTNGHHGSLTPQQERFIGMEDPEISGRWDYTGVPVPDLLTQMLAMEPVSGLDRRLPRTGSGKGVDRS